MEVNIRSFLLYPRRPAEIRLEKNPNVYSRYGWRTNLRINITHYLHTESGI